MSDAQLVSLHLMESPKLSQFITRYEQPGEHLVEKVRYVESVPRVSGTAQGRALPRPEAQARVVAGLAPARKSDAAESKPAAGDPSAALRAGKPLPYPLGRVYINKTQYFEGVPKDVWEFHIGGYQVCEKWLKDRKARTLSWDDIQHYQKIVVALKETIRLMAEIDALIPSWPLP